jgi:hypothetical protein
MWSSELRRACAACVGVLAVMTSAPPAARAQAPVAPPPPVAASAAPSSLPPPRPRTPLVWAGASLFALSYVASAYSATTAYQANDGTTTSRTVMWVPLVGPFILLGSTHAAGNDALLVLDGLAQIGGLTLFVYGLTSTASVAAPREATRSATISLAPLVDRRTAGASVTATF